MKILPLLVICSYLDPDEHRASIRSLCKEARIRTADSAIARAGKTRVISAPYNDSWTEERLNMVLQGVATVTVDMERVFPRPDSCNDVVFLLRRLPPRLRNGGIICRFGLCRGVRHDGDFDSFLAQNRLERA